jgi:TetR/AcrR family transcriptional regulator, transcriptional repressor for nem operon
VEGDVRYTSGHKAQTRTQIIEAAARVFRSSGFAGASVGQIMKEAGLTVGGFYAHFDSKEELFAAALASAFQQSIDDRAAGLDPKAPDWAAAFAGRYLSEEHRADIANGCPMPALTNEVSRDEGQARETSDSCVEDFVVLLTDRLDHGGAHGTDTALAVTALCVGGMSLARATSNDQLARQLLSACRDAATALLDSPPAQPDADA